MGRVRVDPNVPANPKQKAEWARIAENKVRRAIEGRKPHLGQRRKMLTRQQVQAAELYARGMSGRNAHTVAGYEDPTSATRNNLANMDWMRVALNEARNSTVKFSTLDRAARQRQLALLADDAQPAIIHATVARDVQKALKKSGDETMAEAALREDASLSDLERAQRMLKSSEAEDAEAQRTAIDVRDESETKSLKD